MQPSHLHARDDPMIGLFFVLNRHIKTLNNLNRIGLQINQTNDFNENNVL
jgi:hypothetical protein